MRANVSVKVTEPRNPEVDPSNGSNKVEDPGPWFTHTHLILEMMGLNVVFVMVRWVTLDPGKTRGAP